MTPTPFGGEHPSPKHAQAEHDTAPFQRKAAKLGADKLTPNEQRRRVIKAAREAVASEDDADLDAAVKKVAKPGQGWDLPIADPATSLRRRPCLGAMC